MNRYHLNRSQENNWIVFDLRANRPVEYIRFQDFERASAFVNYLNRTYQLSESRRLALMRTFSEDELRFTDTLIQDSEFDSGI